MFDIAVIEGPGWCNPDDLWGRGYTRPDDCAIYRPRENPVTWADWPGGLEPETKAWQRMQKERKEAGFDPRPGFKWFPPKAAHSVLIAYGLWMSTNPKTVLTVSTPRVGSDILPHLKRADDDLERHGTCRPTKWCSKHCYGKGERFQTSKAMSKFVSNLEFFLLLKDLMKHQPTVLEDVAGALRSICWDYRGGELTNLRWHAIGDLIVEEFPLIDELTRDGEFTVWGFTRKHELLMHPKFPTRDNVVFWCSVDNTMSKSQMRMAIEAAKYQGTGLAFATEYGTRTKGHGEKPPWRHAPEHKSQPSNYVDPKLLEVMSHTSVCFGYHGSRRMTKVFPDGGGNECPATDPRGGGHFLGTCQMCGWCIRKAKNRPYKTLLENRKRYVEADNYQDRSYGEIYLDDGRDKAGKWRRG